MQLPGSIGVPGEIGLCIVWYGAAEMRCNKWPWRTVDGIEMIRIFRPDCIKIAKQRELRDCAVVTVDMLLRYLEVISDPQASLPDYEAIFSGLRDSSVAHATNIRKYVSGETIVDFFNREVETTVRWKLVQETADSFDDLIAAIVETRLPVLASYMTQVGHPVWVIPTNLALTIPNALSCGEIGKAVTGGEPYVLNYYLHSGVAMAVIRYRGKRFVLLADPWSGFSHSEARGLVWIEESDFCRCWLGYDQHGIRLPWVEWSYKSDVKPEFDRLGGPGGMLILSGV